MFSTFKSQCSLTPVDLLLVEDLSLARCTKDNKHLSGVPCLSTAASSSLSILRLKSRSFSEDASFSLQNERQCYLSEAFYGLTSVIFFLLSESNGVKVFSIFKNAFPLKSCECKGLHQPSVYVRCPPSHTVTGSLRGCQEPQ